MRGLVVGNNLNATAAVGQDLGADGPPRCPLCGSQFSVHSTQVPALNSQLSAVRQAHGPEQGRRALNSHVLQVGDLILETRTRTVWRAGKQNKLSPREALLLEFLMLHAGEECKRKVILENAWGYRFNFGTKVLEMNINRLRAKIDTGFETRMIETVFGVGYRLSALG